MLLDSAPLCPLTAPLPSWQPLLTFYSFFNSSYSEKETLGTISNENPGIHEAWVRHVNAFQLENLFSKALRGTAFPGLESWSREQRPCPGLTSPDGAGMHRCRGLRGPRARREFDYFFTKGLLTTLHSGKPQRPCLKLPPPSAEGPKDISSSQMGDL